MERCRLTVLADDEAVVMQLDARSSKPVEIAHSRQAIDLQLEPHNEERRIHERAETPPRRGALGQRATYFGRVDRRIEAHVAALGTSTDPNRQKASVVCLEP
jgi:hypothetical protein